MPARARVGPLPRGATVKTRGAGRRGAVGRFRQDLTVADHRAHVGVWLALTLRFARAHAARDRAHQG
jgi:hypothetical protein